MPKPNILQDLVAWREARLKRLTAQKVVEAMEEKEKDLKKAIIEALQKSPTKAFSNGERLFQLVKSDEPTVEDWPKLQAHIKKTGEFDLIQRRLAPAAVKERWEVKKSVPGVGSIPVFNISDTKAKE